jgi:hypothetical protein
MKATDLPELRSRILRYLDSDMGQSTWESYADTDRVLPGVMRPGTFKGCGADLLADERARWQHGELFYVTPDMTEVAVVAGRSLPSFSLLRSDLPSDYGVLYFETPIDRTPFVSEEGYTYATLVHACAWGLFVARDPETMKPEMGVWMSFWTDQRDTLRQKVDLGLITPTEAEHIIRRVPPLGQDDEGLWRFGVYDDRQDISGRPVAQMMATIRAAWLLMQQPLATITTAHPRKADARRMKRHQDRPQSRPRRQPPPCGTHPSADPGDETRRTYDHRWVVRGHWRKQWYPSRNDHLPIWISPHVKGPDGAPLLTGEKVNAWRR